MTHWPIQQRNVFTLLPMNTNKFNPLTHHHINSPSQSTPDDSLTNLSWLHDINILKRTIPTINSSSNSNVLYPNDIEDNHQLILNDEDDEQWRNYRSNPQAKPVYSYSQLILLAMKRSGYEKMTLQMIYEWVAENFPYFKKMEPTWQNSIRHNLSLNKSFIKVPRTKKESGGKGGFWKLSPEYHRQSSTNKRIRSTAKRSEMHVKNEPINRMPSSFLSPISSPDSLPIPTHCPYPHDFPSILTLSPPTKFDETDILSLDSLPFDWDAYLSETPNDLDVQSLLLNKTEQDLFNDFNAALTDLTYSTESAAAAGGDPSAFDGFDYPNKSHSTFHALFDDEEPLPSQLLTVKGRGIKRPAWWLTNEFMSSTKLPSLETAFDLKFSSK